MSLMEVSSAAIGPCQTPKAVNCILESNTALMREKHLVPLPVALPVQTRQQQLQGS